MEELVTMDDELDTVIPANMLTFLILHSFVQLIYSDSLVYPSKQTFPFSKAVIFLELSVACAIT